MAKAKSKTLLTTRDNLSALIGSARKILRKDKGLNGDVDRLPLLTWVMFLKFLDDLEIVHEQEAELDGKPYQPIIEVPYRWRDWAAREDGITGDELLAFIGQEQTHRADGSRGQGLFAYLRSLAGEGEKGSQREVIANVFKGVQNRMVRGSDVVSVRGTVRANQLILSKIDARNGAIGLVPPELDGAIVSNDFPSFNFRDEHRCDPAYMGWLVRSASFVELCKAASEETTNRVRIKENRFLDQQITLPPLADQQALVTRIDALADKTRQVEAHIAAAERDAEHLLALQFRDAIANAPLRPMAEVAPLLRREVSIDSEASYTELGVRSFYKGTFKRRTVPGSEFTWQDLYRVKKDDLIFSNIMAWEQGIALAKPEDDDCVGNHRMLTCEANPDCIVPGSLYYYFTTPEGFAKVYAASPGTAARNRTLTAPALMAIEVPTPPLAAQQRFDHLQSQVAALKAKHAAIRTTNAALLPATLEWVFS
jgi:type I restriction enzyme S subunit